MLSFIIGGVHMAKLTKYEFATKLYIDLKEKHDIQNTINSIRLAKKGDKILSVDEQLEITNLIRQIYTEKEKGLFEDVSAFLALVNQVEAQIKAQSNSNSGGSNNANK